MASQFRRTILAHTPRPLRLNNIKIFKFMKSKKPEPVFKSIFDIELYKPGQSKIKGVKNPIKLSSNENPFGASAKTLKAIAEATKKIHRYPEGTSKDLREAIAEYFDIDAERIVCGAGSDELISLLCQAYAGEGDEVIYSQHGFLIYPIATLRSGAKPVMAEEKNLRTDISAIIKKVTPRTRMVFIANPNNPTGSYINKSEIQKLRRELPDNVLLVIDSAYAEYVDEKDYTAGIDIVEKSENVVMTRTFSKIYGLGGIRLGWAYCPRYIAEVLNRSRGPFNVSNVAQAAGIAALADKKFIKKSHNHNTKWRKIVADEITKLGFKVYPSSANFILADFGSKKKAEQIDAALKVAGIIGRMVSAYGLPSCIRFTIGLESENRTLLSCLKKFAKK